MVTEIFVNYNNEALQYKGQVANDSHYKRLITADTDVYDQNTGRCILKFRKGAIDKQTIKHAFEAVRSHSSSITDLRKTASSKGEVMSNVIGYFIDGIALWAQKKRLGLSKPFRSNITAWNRKNPDKFEQMVYPLYTELNQVYKVLFPSVHEEHMKEANKTEFHIHDTPWSTTTINRDFQTRYHTDKNNCPIGIGNLVVYEESPYTGGYLVFPCYDIAVDVRMGDVLFMDQFQLHGNTPIVKTNPDMIGRVSFVSYLHNHIIKDVDKGSNMAFYLSYLDDVACRLGTKWNSSSLAEVKKGTQEEATSEE